MVQLVIGGVILLVGVPFLIRGWIFTLRPEGATSNQAKERNLRLGLETDMKKWGRRVRRFGLLLTVIGGALTAWGVTSVTG